MLDEWEWLKRDGAGARVSGRGTMVCGTLVAPTMERICGELAESSELDIIIVPVTNGFLGATVTVSGLLAGRDVVAALKGRDLGSAVFISRAMLDAAGQVTLDGMARLDMEASLGVRLVAASNAGAVVECFAGIGGSCR